MMLATAMGEVGSLAISSSMTDTGCITSKPARATQSPAMPTSATTTRPSAGVQRFSESRAAGTRASGRRKAAMTAKV